MLHAGKYTIKKSDQERRTNSENESKQFKLAKNKVSEAKKSATACVAKAKVNTVIWTKKVHFHTMLEGLE